MSSSDSNTSKGKQDRGRGRRRGRDFPKFSVDVEAWQPRTKVGMMVKEGVITTINELFARSLPINDPEIVDILVPNLQEKVLHVGRVQRQTDAGRKTLFVSTAGVGNEDGIVGVGEGKAQGVGTSIRSAISNAKLNITPVKRGCGSWECTCGSNHSLPFKVRGKTASVTVNLMPAPKGLGLVIGDTAKAVLRLTGIQDVWSRTFGDTRTTTNFAKATFNALKATYNISQPIDWAY